MTINWRGEICRFLGNNELTDDEILDALEVTSGQLREMKRLKGSEPVPSNSPRFLVIYQVRCSGFDRDSGLYEDPPWLVKSGPHLAHVRGSNAIQNLDLYLQQNKGITFIIYRDYECCGTIRQFRDRTDKKGKSDVNSNDLMVGEHMSIISEELRSAFKKLSQSALSGMGHPDFDVEATDEVPHPYLWWFHRRAEIEKTKPMLSSSFQEQLSIFQGYLESSLGDEWAAVDSLLSQEIIKAKYLHYLFVYTISYLLSSPKNSLLTASRFRMRYASRSGKAVA